MTHKEYMKEAIKMAKIALTHGDVPVGAIIVHNDIIIGYGENRREVDSDPFAHAEIIALKSASCNLGSWNLSNASMYVTLEPCAMCSGAIINARIRNVFFGAFDGRFGCCGSIYNLPQDKKFNHNANITGGVMNKECKELIQNYFAKKKTYNYVILSYMHLIIFNFLIF